MYINVLRDVKDLELQPSVLLLVCRKQNKNRQFIQCCGYSVVANHVLLSYNVLNNRITPLL